jgi:hypothetical protein
MFQWFLAGMPQKGQGFHGKNHAALLCGSSHLVSGL